MSLKSLLAKPYAKHIAGQYKAWNKMAYRLQTGLLQQLLLTAKDTAFAKDHDLWTVRNHEEYKRQVPIRDYEGLRPYVDRIILGESDVLWPERPLYFAKTSGTTSGVKFIPISKASITYHINAARNALLLYIADTGNTDFLNGKMIFLSGSPKVARYPADMANGVLTGRLSGIVNHHVPRYLRGNQLPSFETNCIEDWETKLDQIVEETFDQKLSLISGIPPWVQMYFERLIDKGGKPIKELFPEFSLFVHGGVNFEPYRAKMEQAMGGQVDTIETYPASEGFIAFQDKQNEEGLLLNLNAGIFYEFVPAEEIYQANPTRLGLEEVALGVNYAIILTTNAGLWAYNIGDTVKFISKDPYKLVVTGRVAHFISAFGEHVIAEEVEKSMQAALADSMAKVTEYTVAPQVNPSEGLPYHEWFVEFDTLPENLTTFAQALDEALVYRNSYYKDLIVGKILQPLKIVVLEKDAFRQHMNAKGKLGGQNKVPRLSNDRKFVEGLEAKRKTNTHGIN